MGDRPLCVYGDRCILKTSLTVETRDRRFFQCTNIDQIYRTVCNFIDWVDTENPQNDGTRRYSRSETRSNYLRRISMKSELLQKL
uniref:GRF-type domain-containing protein n=1 Tax=Oryza punctata TaxID=4537 RepID=A0A0E0K0H9_ORYPU